MPGESRDLVLERLRSALAGLGEVSVELDQLVQECYTGVKLTELDFIPGWRADANNGWQARILSVLQSAGLNAEIFAAPFGTNASSSAGLRGIPSFILGPGSILQAHTTNEWISVDQLIKGERAYAVLAAIGST